MAGLCFHFPLTCSRTNMLMKHDLFMCSKDCLQLFPTSLPLSNFFFIFPFLSIHFVLLLVDFLFGCKGWRAGEQEHD